MTKVEKMMTKLKYALAFLFGYWSMDTILNALPSVEGAISSPTEIFAGVFAFFATIFILFLIAAFFVCNWNEK